MVIQLTELARIHPEYKIDVANLPYASLEWMHATLASYTDNLRVHSKITNYRIYFAFAVVLIQLFFMYVLGLNVDGFARAQLKIIGSNRYDELLTEIGENHSIESVGGWPPEIRLAIAVGINIVLFVGLHVIGRFVGKKTGAGDVATKIMETFHSTILDIVAPAPAGAVMPRTWPGVDGQAPADLPQEPESFEGEGMILKCADAITNVANLFVGAPDAKPAAKPAAAAATAAPRAAPLRRPATPALV